MARLKLTMMLEWPGMMLEWPRTRFKLAWEDVGITWDDVGIHCVTYVQGHAAQLTVSILLRVYYTNHVCVR